MVVLSAGARVASGVGVFVWLGGVAGVLGVGGSRFKDLVRLVCVAVGVRAGVAGSGAWLLVEAGAGTAVVSCGVLACVGDGAAAGVGVCSVAGAGVGEACVVACAVAGAWALVSSLPRMSVQGSSGCGVRAVALSPTGGGGGGGASSMSSAMNSSCSVYWWYESDSARSHRMVASSTASASYSSLSR